MLYSDFETRLRQTTEPWSQAIIDHPLYRNLDSLAALQSFASHHVYAVWDFMCLLKALQRSVTSVDMAWRPKGSAGTRRLINQIVIGEECDIVPDGCMSHFELYLAAMEELDIDTHPVKRFIDRLEAGHLIQTALRDAPAPSAAQTFVLSTMDIVNQGRPHMIAAAFSIGREHLIPAMFIRMVKTLPIPRVPKLFLYYLERHVEVDSNEHDGLAAQMLAELCRDDAVKWAESSAAAVASLQARLALWNAINEEISQKKGQENND